MKVEITGQALTVARCWPSVIMHALMNRFADSEIQLIEVFVFACLQKPVPSNILLFSPSLGQKWLFLWISLLPLVSDTNKTRAQMWKSFWFLYFLESRSGCYLLMGSVYSTPVIHRPSPKICHFHILSAPLINYFFSWNQLKFNFFICSWRKCNLTTINER